MPFPENLHKNLKSMKSGHAVHAGHQIWKKIRQGWFLARKITDKLSIFQQAMFDCQRVNSMCLHSS